MPDHTTEDEAYIAVALENATLFRKELRLALTAVMDAIAVSDDYDVRQSIWPALVAFRDYALSVADMAVRRWTPDPEETD